MEDIFNMFDISFTDQDQVLAVLLSICVCLFVIFSCLGLNREYERSVVFRLGRVLPVKGPGVFWKWPILDRVEHVDLRTVTEALQTQETVSKDGVSVAVNAVMWYRAADPQKIVLNAATGTGQSSKLQRLRFGMPLARASSTSCLRSEARSTVPCLPC